MVPDVQVGHTAPAEMDAATKAKMQGYEGDPNADRMNYYAFKETWKA